MLSLIIYLALIGLIAWAAVALIPMPDGIKRVIVVVAIVACVIVALNAFGLRLPNPSVPQLR